MEIVDGDCGVQVICAESAAADVIGATVTTESVELARSLAEGTTANEASDAVTAGLSAAAIGTTGSTAVVFAFASISESSTTELECPNPTNAEVFVLRDDTISRSCATFS